MSNKVYLIGDAHLGHRGRIPRGYGDYCKNRYISTRLEHHDWKPVSWQELIE